MIFKLTPSGTSGTQSEIHAFSGPDGSDPQGPLVSDAAGNLYGTTYNGGAYGAGTVFQLAPSSGGTWTETVIDNSTGSPGGGLVFDQAGNLYGTTLTGGAGAGTIFKLAPSSGGAWTETALYSFTNGLDGRCPQGPLVLDAGGHLYGTTSGTVFQLTPGSGGWTETVLYTFGGYPDVSDPIFGSLTRDAAGNLYGTTVLGGAALASGVFESTP